MVDPQVRAFLDTLEASNVPPVENLSVREARKLVEVSSLLLGKPPEMARTDDFEVPGPGGPIKVRLVVPRREREASSKPLPALIYFHGGGWVTGSIRTHDLLCREIASRSGLAVLSVDYRLAPEAPFPGAVDDAEAATSWIFSHAEELGLDPARIAVGGDSSGGNLAAVVALRFRDQQGPSIAFQVLLYPVVDCDLNTCSYLENAEGYLLTRESMAWYWDQYVPDLERRIDPDASPLRASSLAELPPALVITAEFDPLRDEAEAYARRLGEAGVSVKLSRYPGMIHGFIRRHGLFDGGNAALDEIAQTLQTTFETSP